MMADRRTGEACAKDTSSASSAPRGYPVLEEDMARLSPFVNSHLGVHGTYNFVLPDLAPGTIRELRNLGVPEEGDD